MGPRWLVPGVEGVLLVGLVVTTPTRHYGQSPRRRALVIALLGLVSAATLASLVLLAHYLLAGQPGRPASRLIFAGGVLWLTKILVFGIWFWELDRGGPGMRSGPDGGPPRLPVLRRCVRRPSASPAGGRGSSTTSTPRSPTRRRSDPPTRVPLTALAKGLMALESLIALTTLLLVVSRAVNVLG